MLLTVHLIVMYGTTSCAQNRICGPLFMCSCFSLWVMAAGPWFGRLVCLSSCQGPATGKILLVEQKLLAGDHSVKICSPCNLRWSLLGMRGDTENGAKWEAEPPCTDNHLAATFLSENSLCTVVMLTADSSSFNRNGGSCWSLLQQDWQAH